MSIAGHKLKSGWGVFRRVPWHLAGVFETSIEAEAKASQLGSDYKIRYGETRPGTDELIWSDPGTV